MPLPAGDKTGRVQGKEDCGVQYDPWVPIHHGQ